MAFISDSFILKGQDRKLVQDGAHTHTHIREEGAGQHRFSIGCPPVTQNTGKFQFKQAELVTKIKITTNKQTNVRLKTLIKQLNWCGTRGWTRV